MLSVLFAESFLEHGSEAMNGADRHQVVIHISAETLQQRTAGVAAARGRAVDCS